MHAPGWPATSVTPEFPALLNCGLTLIAMTPLRLTERNTRTPRRRPPSAIGNRSQDSYGRVLSDQPGSRASTRQGLEADRDAQAARGAGVGGNLGAVGSDDGSDDG